MMLYPWNSWANVPTLIMKTWWFLFLVTKFLRPQLKINQTFESKFPHQAERMCRGLDCFIRWIWFNENLWASRSLIDELSQKRYLMPLSKHLWGLLMRMGYGLSSLVCISISRFGFVPQYRVISYNLWGWNISLETWIWTSNLWFEQAEGIWV